MENKFTLYTKILNFQKYLYLLIKNFPKEYKYTLGEQIIQTSWDTLDNVIGANIAPNNKKVEKIILASESFDKLKARLKMAHELRLISHDKYSYVIKENQKIGIEINGWLKWAKKQA